MKINLKNKIMLTVLAGGMLCANSVFATNWYGTEYNKWTTVQGDAGTTGLRLTINNSTKDVGGNGWDGIENIYGSYSTSAHITDNIVSITGGIFTGLSNIESGCAEGDSNTVMNCMLNVSGGTFGNVTNLQVGYSKNGTLKNNILNITGGDLRGVRFIQGVFGDSGDKENNIVNISGGTFPSNVEIKGAYSSNRATVKGNKVYITGGDFTGEAKIYGASTNIYVSTVQDNLVEISGGTFGGNVEIYGACQNNAGPVTGNTVTISGGDFGSGIKLYGGMGSTSSNNTLNLKIKMGSKANEVKFFQNMNFTLPSNITNGDVMLETASVTYDNTTIGVDAANGVKLNSGDVITLIAADDKNGDVSNINETVLGGAGVISMDGNNLILTLLKDFGVGGDRGKAPVEGIAAATAMINQSADLALGEGLASLLANTLQTEEKETEPANENNSNIATSPVVNTFGAVTANRSKYKTGSHVDMDGWGFLVGAGTSKNWTSGDKTTYGLFFEYGKGDFDTYNNDIHGEGDSNNKGVGVIARHTLKNNTYIDGAVRYG
ncbi:MAG: autotransporter outer membrane beta-barrel domain-containing protein, partial [Phascolarctobacterium sp.]|nr:autotransporter outer membrane beta-barrel domain-containing protein [Candidatus Phascolarctobacterium caballi]